MSKVHAPRLVALTLLVAQLFVSPSRVAAQQIVGASAPAVVAKTNVEADAAARRRESFEIVWQTVKDYHFDPNFGGVNWDAVKAEFAPRVAAARTDRELHFLLQQMLNRLGKSHFAVIPPESIPALDDGAGDDDDTDTGATDKLTRKKPTREGLALTERLTHGLRLDLRLINGAAVVTRVEQGSAAERAGLRAGFVIRSVDGVSVREMLREYAQTAVYEPALRHQIPEAIAYEYLDGDAGTTANVGYLDARNVLRRTVVRREQLNGEMSAALPGLPPQFVEFESKRLRDGVAYVRFNVFAAPVMEKFCAALRAMADAPALIIDLRGNGGGMLTLVQGMGSLLAKQDAIFGEMRTRSGGTIFRVSPARHPFKGSVAVLIDDGSQSASEMFASGLQESGRAVLVGERSAGATLPSVAKELPTGAILQYAFADFVSPYGKVLEGKGVEPDIPVKLDRRSLLAGRDAQLEAALAVVSPGAGATVTLPSFSPVNLPDDADADNGAKSDATKDVAPSIDPKIAEIIEKYLTAIGGREAIMKIKSRVSTGTFEGVSQGVRTSGSVEIDERAPDSAVTIIGVPGVGAMRRGYTGKYGYEQFALMGFRELKGVELEALKVEADFRRDVDLARLYPKLELKGTEKVGDAEAYVVEATRSRGWFPTKFYFDTQTGLLLRQDLVTFEDYREVDGVRLPFKIRSPLLNITLKEIRQNVPLDDSVFAERKDCFTQ